LTISVQCIVSDILESAMKFCLVVITLHAATKLLDVELG